MIRGADSCVAVVPCAGMGTRMGAGKPKFVLDLGGTSILGLTLQRLQACALISQIVLVLPPSWVERFEEIVPPSLRAKISFCVSGGAERQDSIWHALQALAGRREPFQVVSVGETIPFDVETGLVAVHDGARPFATPELIARVIDAARLHRAAIPAIPTQDTIKKINRDGAVERTLDRSELVQVQTPQVFRYTLLYQAYEKAYAAGILGTDDAFLVEHLGIKIQVTPGEKMNMKITTPEDLIVARTLWQEMSKTKGQGCELA